MAWTPQTPIAVDMPGTAEWANSVQDNLVAVADGDTGAPKVRGVALGNVYLGSRSYSGTGGDGFTGLDRVKLIRCDGLMSGGSNSMRVRFTSDNGANWGAWQDTTLTNANTSVTLVSFSIDLLNGFFRYVGTTVPTATATAGGLVRYGNDDLVQLAGCNGVQFGMNGGGGTTQYHAYTLEGRA